MNSYDITEIFMIFLIIFICIFGVICSILGCISDIIRKSYSAGKRQHKPSDNNCKCDACKLISKQLRIIQEKLTKLH